MESACRTSVRRNCNSKLYAPAFGCVWYCRGLVQASVATRSCALSLSRCFSVALSASCVFLTRVRHSSLPKSEFWGVCPLDQDLSELLAQCDSWYSLFFVVLWQWLRDLQTILFCPCWLFWPVKAEMLWFLGLTLWGWGAGVAYWTVLALEEKPVICCAVDVGRVCCSVTLWAAAGQCIKLLMCYAVDRCLDLISNLWLFLKACSRDCIPTHTAPVTPSISWVFKYRTEKIH